MPTGNLITFSYAGITKEVAYRPDLEDQVKLVRQKFPIPTDVDVVFFRYQLQLESQVDEDAWPLLGEVSKVLPVVIHIREETAHSWYPPAKASGDRNAANSTTQTHAISKATTTLPPLPPPPQRKKTPRDVPSEEDDDESLDDVPARPSVKRKLNPPTVIAASGMSTIRIGPPKGAKRLKISNTKLNPKHPQVTSNTKVGPPTSYKPKPAYISISSSPSPQPQSQRQSQQPPRSNTKPPPAGTSMAAAVGVGDDSETSSASNASNTSYFWHSKNNQLQIVESAKLNKSPCTRCRKRGIFCRKQADNRVNGKGKIAIRCFECRRNSEKCSFLPSHLA